MEDVVIGIDFGGTTIKFGWVTRTGHIKRQWSIATPAKTAPETVMAEIVQEIKRRVSSAEHLLGVGLGIPGSVRPDTLAVYDCNNLGWNKDTDILALLQKGLDIPLVIENDANAATIGEKWQDSTSKDNLMYVTLGTGVGAGIVLNDQLVHGFAGAAGELGHVIVDPKGFKCTCGNRGCLETVSSATGIVRLYQKESGQDEVSITAKEIFDQAKQNSPLALNVVDQACDYLGLALANVANVLNLEEIIIGGGVAAAGEFLRARVERAVDKYLYFSAQNHITIKLASLGNDAGILGMAKLVLQKVNK